MLSGMAVSVAAKRCCRLARSGRPLAARIPSNSSARVHLAAAVVRQLEQSDHDPAGNARRMGGAQRLQAVPVCVARKQPVAVNQVSRAPGLRRRVWMTWRQSTTCTVRLAHPQGRRPAAKVGARVAPSMHSRQSSLRRTRKRLR